MNTKVGKRCAMLVLLLLLVTVFAVPTASAVSYSKIYGKTVEKVRVRESASTNAKVIDNIVKDACVYITSSKTSGNYIFVQLKYRDSSGEISTGWTCQNDGNKSYISMLSAAQAKDKFGVSGGNVPSTRVGTFTAAQRKAATTNSSKNYVKVESGSSSETVKTVQTQLKAIGLYKGEITGNAGNKTVAAIRAFQNKYGLTADGVAGPATLAKLAAVYEDKGGSGSSSSGSSSVNGALKLNSQGSAVKTLQSNLKALGYYTAEITGNFGTKTEAAVKKFQSDKNLTADGVAGKKTLDAINSALKGGSGSSSSGSSGTVLKLGASGTSVTALQQNLTALGYYYGDITGHYGSMTETAVKKFQKAKGLSQTGNADSATLSAINTAVSKQGGSAATNNVTTGTYREGDSGSVVTEIQTMLKSLGLYTGSISGNFGSLTKQSVRAFQSKYGLTVDGVVGSTTLAKMRSATGTTSTGGSSTSGSGTTVSVSESYGKVSKNNVYLRSSYSTSSAGKAVLRAGDYLRITKKYTVNGETWYYVTVAQSGYTYTGYIRSDMVTKVSEAEYSSGYGVDSADQEVLGLLKVTGTTVNLRYNPTETANVVGTAKKDEVFYYINSVSGWYQTSAGYWINSQYATPVTDSKEIASLIGSSSSSSSSAVSYKLGDTGEMVKWIQEALTTTEHYNREITGHFGVHTENAVKAFQRASGLKADGVVGASTLSMLQNAVSDHYTGDDAGVTYQASFYELNWFTAKNANHLATYGLERGKSAKLTDLTSGKTLNIYIQSAGNHLDVEPKTAADTRILCQAYGVGSASGIGWEARPMLITTVTNHQIVCSIYGEEHGAQTITDNNYDGQFCLHFNGSTTHVSNQVLQRHKDAIAKAKEIMKTKTNGTCGTLN